MPWSMVSLFSSRKSQSAACLGAGTLPSSDCANASRLGPETRTTPMAARPGAVAIAAITSALAMSRLCPLDDPRDLPLLGNGENVVYQPVQDQTSREEAKENTEGKRRMAQLHTGEQHPVKRNEYRDLYHYWQTSPQRIDFLSFVKLHHRLMQPLPIITVLLL